jgi:hypothetical protein
MDNVFAELDAWVTSLMLAGLMLASAGIGWWGARRLRRDGGESPSGKFDDAAMGLVGLLLAFTFAMSLGKHDQRRLMLVADSNAIGDFYTCASLLKDPVRTKLQAVIREYGELRLSTARTASDEAALEKALERTQQLQGRMTDLVAEAVNDGTPVVVPLTNTLNGVTSSHASRLAAYRDRLPASIVLLLYLAAAVSTVLLGRQQGASGKLHLAGLLSYILLVTLVVYVTLDLNQPRRGLITVSQEPLERLIRSMAK